MTPPDGVHRTVLVADDDPVARLVLAHQLGRLGCEVAQAEDVASALALAVSLDVSLVVSDFEMPDGTGLDLMARLGGAVPFVIMTGVVEHAGADARIAAHLTKPVSTRALVACLRRVWPGWAPP